MSKENELWCEKYRPKTIEECILPKELKKVFAEFVKKDFVPNLLLNGGAGVGKTTVAKAMLDECGFDYIMINASSQRNIDTLRTDIQQFASTMSFSGKRKYVILDEADNLNAQSTQPALRNFMETFSKNCGFIFTCNSKGQIIGPLHSRCSVIDFIIPVKERADLAKQFMKRIGDILTAENIEYDQKVVAELIMKHFPDWRRVLNELQRYSASGKIDTGILVNLSDENFKTLLKHLKEKNFNSMRKWVGQNSDIEASTIFRKLYDVCFESMQQNSIPQLILHLSDYDYKSAFVADQEVNLVACLTEIMSDCEWK